MHISEGILGAPVLASGAALTVAGTAIGLKKMDYEKLPAVALLSAVFFIASLVHVPVGPAAAHLVLSGLCGVLLGWLRLSRDPCGSYSARDTFSVRRTDNPGRKYL